MNNTDPPLSLTDDQCVSAVNVEWVDSMLAERRRGMAAIDLSAALEAESEIAFLTRHLPSNTEADAELWVYAITGTATDTLARKTTSWSEITMTDANTLTNGAAYRMQAVTLHGKLFVAYQDNVTFRLHVWDGTSFRRVGLIAPSAAPTGANTGTPGVAFTGTRYYRTRDVVLSGSIILLRSEPTAVLTFAPSGTGTGVVVTKPLNMGEGATHWELEASTDNADFYRIARTVVGTTTVTDSVVYATGYATTGTLSEQIGDYELPHSAKFLLVDEDRLILLGHHSLLHNGVAMGSRMAWTPVFNDPGVGNDERIPLDPVSYRDLDTYEGGDITGGVGPVNGEIWIFKRSHIYKAVRTNVRTNAYDVTNISKKRGAIEGSIVEAVDQLGSPCVYFLDPKVGPCRVGSDGVVQRCGRDIWTTWKTVNLNATKVVSRVLFYDNVGQVQWHVATGSSNVPNKVLVLHVEQTRDTRKGVRGGWAIWDGDRAGVLSACLYSTNIDANAARNLTLVPFVGLAASATVCQTDTGTTDNGTEFTASIQTKPYAPATILNKFGVMNGALLAAAEADAVVDVVATRDFGLETLTAIEVPLDATASETSVIKALDALTFSELTTVDFTISDNADNAGRWEINQLALRERPEQSS
jgi:hypothetical protein